MKFKKILAPTDLSELSRVGLRYALDMALERGAEVVVYHVVSEDTDWFDKNDELNPAAALVPRQRQRLAEFMKENFPEFLGKLTINELVEIGVPYKAIVQRAEENKTDLIVISTHGRSGLEQAIVGGVTARIIALAGCPILSIRPPK